MSPSAQVAMDGTLGGGSFGLRAAAGVGGAYAPTPDERAAVDQWINGNPAYGSRSAAVWQLGADNRTLAVPTNNGATVRFGFGSGVLAAFAQPGNSAASAAAAPQMPARVVAPVAVLQQPAEVAPSLALNFGTPLEDLSPRAPVAAPPVAVLPGAVQPVAPSAVLPVAVDAGAEKQRQLIVAGVVLAVLAFLVFSSR